MAAVALSCSSASSTDEAAPDAAFGLDVADPLPDVTPVEDADGSLPGEDAQTSDIASPPDALPAGQVAAPPFGAVDGPCAELAQLLLADGPSFRRNIFLFDADPFDPDDLGPDARPMYDAPNAGGSSKCSEIFSMVALDACLGADLYKTETTIEYTAEGSITDLEITVGGERYGVSVTRAYKGPITEFTSADATALLTKKLEGINESTANVAPADAWKRQILYVWTLNEDWSDIVWDAWKTLDAPLKSDTVVIVTIESGAGYVTSDTCDD